MDDYACTHLTPRTIYALTPRPQNSFDESRNRFPPSYRRKYGYEGDCGDYTDTARVSGAGRTRTASHASRAPCTRGCLYTPACTSRTSNASES